MRVISGVAHTTLEPHALDLFFSESSPVTSAMSDMAILEERNSWCCPASTRVGARKSTPPFWSIRSMTSSATAVLPRPVGSTTMQFSEAACSAMSCWYLRASIAPSLRNRIAGSGRAAPYKRGPIIIKGGGEAARVMSEDFRAIGYALIGLTALAAGWAFYSYL